MTGWASERNHSELTCYRESNIGFMVHAGGSSPEINVDTMDSCDFSAQSYLLRCTVLSLGPMKQPAMGRLCTTLLSGQTEGGGTFILTLLSIAPDLGL